MEAGAGKGNETVKRTGATAIAEAVEESAVNSAGAEVASAVAGESLSLHVRQDSCGKRENDSALEAESAMEALTWSTGVKDKGVLNGLLASLPEWSIKEQILAYRDADRQVSSVHKDCKLIVEPSLWHSRMKVAEAFDSFLRSRGVTGNVRIPRNSTTEFVQKKLVLKKGMKNPNRMLIGWRRQWLEAGNRPSAQKAFSKKCVMVALPIRSESARQVGGSMWGALGCGKVCSSGSFPCATRLIGRSIMNDSAVAVVTKLWAVSHQGCCVRKHLSSCWTMCAFAALQVTAVAAKVTAVAA